MAELSNEQGSQPNTPEGVHSGGEAPNQGTQAGANITSPLDTGAGVSTPAPESGGNAGVQTPPQSTNIATSGANQGQGEQGKISDPVEVIPDPQPPKTDNITITTHPNSTQILSSNADVVTDAPLPALPKAGYNLAIFILCIISGFVLFLIIFLIFSTTDASESISKAIPFASIHDSTFTHQKDIIQSLKDEQKNHRDFIVQISQMVLLNLLLPTLTAILGYIFGTREGDSKRNSNIT